MCIVERVIIRTIMCAWERDVYWIYVNTYTQQQSMKLATRWEGSHKYTSRDVSTSYSRTTHSQESKKVAVYRYSDKDSSSSPLPLLKKKKKRRRIRVTGRLTAGRNVTFTWLERWWLILPRTSVLWDETPCDLIDVYQHFGRSYYHRLQGRNVSRARKYWLGYKEKNGRSHERTSEENYERIQGSSWGRFQE
jgi:hypothetical protein